MKHYLLHEIYIHSNFPVIIASVIGFITLILLMHNYFSEKLGFIARLKKSELAFLHIIYLMEVIPFKILTCVLYIIVLAQTFRLPAFYFRGLDKKILLDQLIIGFLV